MILCLSQGSTLEQYCNIFPLKIHPFPDTEMITVAPAKRTLQKQLLTVFVYNNSMEHLYLQFSLFTRTAAVFFI